MSTNNAPSDVALTWLLLSDLHGTPRRYDAPVDDTALLGALYADVHALATVGGAPSMVFVTGDVVHSPLDENYERAATILSQIAEASGANPSQIYAVPGNHDVDRDQLEDELDAVGIRAAIRANPHRFDRALAHYAELLARPMGAFERFASRLARPNGGTSWPSMPAPWWVHRMKANGHALRIVGWNTALTSDATDRVGSVVIPPAMARAALEAAPDELVLVLGHHPLSWFDDGDGLRSTFERSAQVYLHSNAHEHELLGPRRSPGGLVEIATGAFDQLDRDESEAQFRYAMCRLEVTPEGPVLRIWARTAHLIEPSFGPDTGLYGSAGPDESWAFPLRAPSVGWRKGVRGRALSTDPGVSGSVARRMSSSGMPAVDTTPGGSGARRVMGTEPATAQPMQRPAAAAQSAATPAIAQGPAAAPSTATGSRSTMQTGPQPTPGAPVARGNANPTTTPTAKNNESIAMARTMAIAPGMGTPIAPPLRSPSVSPPSTVDRSVPPGRTGPIAAHVPEAVSDTIPPPAAKADAFDVSTDAAVAGATITSSNPLDELAAGLPDAPLPELDDLLPPPGTEDPLSVVIYTAPGPRPQGLLGRAEALAHVESVQPPYSALKTVAILGGLGEGTTSLALDYAARAYHNGFFPGGVLWFDGGAPDPLDASVRNTVRALGGHGGLEALGPTLAKRCVEAGPILLILDGCASASVAPALHGALSMVSVKGLMVVTTADESVALRAAQVGQGPVVRVGALAIEEATSVLLQGTTLRDTQQLARLAKTVARNPLALNALAVALTNGGASAWGVGEEVVKRVSAAGASPNGVLFAVFESVWARCGDAARALWLAGAMAAVDGALPLPWAQTAAGDSGEAIEMLTKAGIALVQGEGPLGTFRLHRLAHMFGKLQIVSLDPMTAKFTQEGFLRGALAVLTEEGESEDAPPPGAEWAVPHVDALLALHNTAPQGAGRTRAAAVALLAGGLGGDIKNLAKVRGLVDEAMSTAGLGNSERRALGIRVLRRIMEHDRARSLNDEISNISVPAALANQLRHISTPEALLEAKSLLESVLAYEKKKRHDDPRLMGRRLELAAVLQRINTADSLRAALALVREVEMAAEWEGSVGERYAEPARKLGSEVNAALKALTGGR